MRHLLDQGSCWNSFLFDHLDQTGVTPLGLTYFNTYAQQDQIDMILGVVHLPQPFLYTFIINSSHSTCVEIHNSQSQTELNIKVPFSTEWGMSGNFTEI